MTREHPKKFLRKNEKNTKIVIKFKSEGDSLSTANVT